MLKKRVQANRKLKTKKNIFQNIFFLINILLYNIYKPNMTSEIDLPCIQRYIFELKNSEAINKDLNIFLIKRKLIFQH